MLRFEHTTVIHRPVDEVFRLYTDQSHMSAWQPGLLDIEKISGTPGQAGAVSKLRYHLGRRKMIMQETILRSEPPATYQVTYQLKGLRHTVTHSFRTKGPRETEWSSLSEIRFKGLMWLIGRFMGQGLYEQQAILMRNFKGYAEQ